MKIRRSIDPVVLSVGDCYDNDDDDELMMMTMIVMLKMALICSPEKRPHTTEIITAPVGIDFQGLVSPHRMSPSFQYLFMHIDLTH